MGGSGLALAAMLALAPFLIPDAALAGTARPQTQVETEAATPWSYCERAAIAIEQTQKLPRALLFSVATAESGRYERESGKARAWPWTINAEGQSYYFDTKKEAVAATRQLLNSGVRSIDVGCMQVNLRYHPDAFANLNEAFDPLTNAAYAASFLKRLHKQTGSWPKAVAQYHSESPSRNEPYFARVIRIWANERDRVAVLTRMLKEEAAEVTKSLRGTTEAAPAPGGSQAPAQAMAAASRPAPKVLSSDETRDVREGAVAMVGLRLSIAEDAGASSPAAARPAPRVIDTPTILADASHGPAL